MVLFVPTLIRTVIASNKSEIAAIMSWFYSDNGQRKGPVDETGLGQLVASGVIRRDTMVWRAGMTEWQKYSDVLQNMPPPTVAIPSTEAGHCGECGRPFPSSELVAINGVLICGTCKPIHLQRLREGGTQAISNLRYAGFWIRFAARLIDGILMQIVFVPLRLMLGLGALGTINNTAASAATIGIMAIGLSLLSFVAGAAYEIFMTGTRGATLGKMAVGIKVVRADGSPVSMGLATGRYFATLVSAITIGVGYIMAGFDDQKRSLHDRICETRVIWTK